MPLLSKSQTRTKTKKTESHHEDIHLIEVCCPKHSQAVRPHLHLEFVAKAHWELLCLYPSLVLEQAAGFRTERQNRVGRLRFRECLR